jgi:hypothetical protein
MRQHKCVQDNAGAQAGDSTWVGLACRERCMQKRQHTRHAAKLHISQREASAKMRDIVQQHRLAETPG